MPFGPQFEINGMPEWPGIENVPACPDSDQAYGKLCSAECTAPWGLPVLPPTQCTP